MAILGHDPTAVVYEVSPKLHNNPCSILLAFSKENVRFTRLNTMNSWPEDFFNFAFVPDSTNKFEELADMAEEEDWGYHNTSSSYPRPILFNYIKYTYKRVAEEGKIALSPDGQFCCFNTGLVTSTQEPIFASFDANRQQDKQPWFFKGWFRKGRWELNKFDELPDMAHYFDDPSCLVLDLRKGLFR